MQHWIFISSTKAFRMNDWLAENDFVEYFQRNKVCVNDIIYLYTTAPVQRIEYKMIVEKINIPLDKIVDDSAYSLRKSPVKYEIYPLETIEEDKHPQITIRLFAKLWPK